jgi:hypothetical protein
MTGASESALRADESLAKNILKIRRCGPLND